MDTGRSQRKERAETGAASGDRSEIIRSARGLLSLRVRPRDEGGLTGCSRPLKPSAGEGKRCWIRILHRHADNPTTPPVKADWELVKQIGCASSRIVQGDVQRPRGKMPSAMRL